jgi:prepilin-type N-terminal cleavage/methylation domain-containing protein
MKNRPGFTLIETLTVLVVTSVLLGTAAGLLHTVFQWQQHGHEGLRQRLAMDRLARQFREDAHTASGLTAAEVSMDGQKKLPGWRLQLAGNRTVQYWVAGDALARSEREGDKTVSREAFALPPGAKVEIGLQGDGKPALARLRITAATEPSANPVPPVLFVEGVLALDHRFAHPADGTPKPPDGKR